MTICSKVSQEIEMKFYANYDLALIDDGTYLIVELNGTTPPTSVIKTVIKDRYSLEHLGPSMSLIGADNLASARFQLIAVPRNIPVKPYSMPEEVYVFEAYI